MKRLPALAVAAMLAVIGLAYYQYQQDAAAKIQQVESKKIVNWRLLELTKVRVVVDDRTLEFSPEGDYWWMRSPYSYPANQEVLFSTFEMMSTILAEEAFKTSADKFGFAAPRGLITLFHRDGREQALRIGSVDAPSNQIYVMNSLDDSIYVVHNAWAQFLHQPVEAYLHKQIFFGADEVTKFEYLLGGNRQWTAEKQQHGEWLVVGQGKSAKIEPQQVLEIWHQLRRVKLKNHKLDTEAPPFNGATFEAWNKDGSSKRIIFSQDFSQVYLQHLRAMADVEAEDVKAIISKVEGLLVKNGN